MTIDPLQTYFLGIALLFATSLVLYYWEYRGLFLIVPLLGLCMFKFSTDYNSFISIVSPIIIGSAAGLTIKRRYSVQFFLLSSVLILTAVTTAFYYYLYNVAGIDIIEMIHNQMTNLIEASDLQASEQSVLYEVMKFFVTYAKMFIPSLFFMNNLFSAVISFIFVRLVYMFFIVRGPVFLRGLEYFRLNDYTVFALIAFLALVLFVGAEKSEALHIIALNGLIITAVLYVIQALGIIRFFLIRKKLPPLILPLGILITFMLDIRLLAVISIFLSGWGVLDLWTDFRHLRSSKDTTT